MNKKLIKQLAVIALVIGFFAAVDCAIYFGITRRYEDNSSTLMQTKSIELDKYLPFTEDSLIVKRKSSLQLTGDLPELDGATALFPIYSAFMNAVYPEGSCEFTGEDFTPQSKLRKRSTPAAYAAVTDGTADIIFVAQPSKEQIAAAEQTGAELVYVPIGYEAFVFITNANNPVSSLTTEQIKGIYTGRYKNWSEVGGSDARILALQRSVGSGSQTAMLDFMGDTPMSDPNATTLLGGKAIGYSFRFYVEGIVANENVRMLSVDGVAPTVENIKNKTYPVTDTFFAVYRADNKNENIPILIDWILSDEGQRIIEETGYVGLD